VNHILAREQAEANPPDETCEECWRKEWKPVDVEPPVRKQGTGSLLFFEGGSVTWKCRNCGSLYTQEGD